MKKIILVIFAIILITFSAYNIYSLVVFNNIKELVINKSFDKEINYTTNEYKKRTKEFKVFAAEIVETKFPYSIGSYKASKWK